MPEKPRAVERILELLAEGPARIAAATASLTADELRGCPAPDEWSASQVLAHLRSCADVWGDCIRRILAEDHPTIRAVNPRTWIERTDYLQQAFEPSLRAFTLQRDALQALLASLPPAGWSRVATVKGAGKTLERSVHSYAQWLATHERPHVKQIERIAARR